MYFFMYYYSASEHLEEALNKYFKINKINKPKISQTLIVNDTVLDLSKVE